jgi:hypothetical protein
VRRLSQGWIHRQSHPERDANRSVPAPDKGGHTVWLRLNFCLVELLRLYPVESGLADATCVGRGVRRRLCAWGSSGEDARYLGKLRRLLARSEDGDRKLLLYMAQKMAGTKSRRAAPSN